MKKLLVLLLSLFMVFALVGCGSNNNETPEQPKNDSNNNEASNQQNKNFDSTYWKGDWYGWWTTSDGKGIYEDLTTKKICFDCYASIDVYEDGTGSLYLWDTETSKGFPLVKADFNLNGKKMNITSGSFFASEEWLKQFKVVKKDIKDITIDPDNSTVSKFDHIIELTGNYEDGGNGFTYHFFLKPWGASWDDVKNGDTSGCIYKNMMPIYHDNWYFSLQNLKENLPDSFEAGIKIINDYIESTKNNEQASSSNLGDKASADGKVDLQTLKDALPKVKSSSVSYSTTYDEIAAIFGVHGRSEKSLFEGKNIYRWWASDDEYIQITFDVKDGKETWNVTQYNGIE